MIAQETTMAAHHQSRHSGLELLRLVSMFFILALHINFYGLGEPSALDFNEAPLGNILRVFLESLTIVGVNCFILISGWFGIRPKTKRVAELLFQCVFFCCLLYGAGLLFGIPFSRRAALKNLFLAGQLNWFIKSYLVLYILSPLMESFINTTSKRTFATVIISFFVFQSFYGWLFPVAEFFKNGYSAVSFMGLYLLARYVRTYHPRMTEMRPIADFTAYSFLSIITTCMFILTRVRGIPVLSAVDWFAYCSPIVIASSLFIFLFFAKLQFQSVSVDALARSSYAVYLFHVHPCVFRPLLIPFVKHAFTPPPHASAISILLVTVILMVVFSLSILFDQLRIVVWKRLSRFVVK